MYKSSLLKFFRINLTQLLITDMIKLTEYYLTLPLFINKLFIYFQQNILFMEICLAFIFENHNVHRLSVLQS